MVRIGERRRFGRGVGFRGRRENMGFRDLTDRLRRVRRLRLQYGLRSLLLATLIACLVLGWYVERVRRQRKAVAALTEAEAKVDYYDSSNPASAASANDAETPITVGERIERLMPERLSSALGTDFFRPVDAVALLTSAVNDRSALTHLRGLPQLRFLHLDNALDEDLSALGSLTELKVLGSLGCAGHRCGPVAFGRAGKPPVPKNLQRHGPRSAPGRARFLL